MTTLQNNELQGHVKKQEAHIGQLESAAAQAEQAAQIANQQHAADLQKLQQELDSFRATGRKAAASSGNHSELTSMRQQVQEAHAQIEALQQQHATAARHESTPNASAASGVPSSAASTPTKPPQATDAQDPATVAPSDKEQVVKAC